MREIIFTPPPPGLWGEEGVVRVLCGWGGGELREKKMAGGGFGCGGLRWRGFELTRGILFFLWCYGVFPRFFMFLKGRVTKIFFFYFFIYLNVPPHNCVGFFFV